MYVYISVWETGSPLPLGPELSQYDVQCEHGFAATEDSDSAGLQESTCPSSDECPFELCSSSSDEGTPLAAQRKWGEGQARPVKMTVIHSSDGVPDYVPIFARP